jgi:hypothetical protein
MAKFEVQLLRAVPGKESRHVDLEQVERHIIEATDAVQARDFLHANLRQRVVVPEGALFVYAHQVRD